MCRGNLADQMDFGQPNAEIGQKMAKGQLLFLALHYMLSISISVFVSNQQ